MILGSSEDFTGIVKRSARCCVLMEQGWHAVELPKIDINKCLDERYATDYIETGQDMMVWCLENALDDFFYVNRTKWLFKDPNKAMLFKLTWGGQ